MANTTVTVTRASASATTDNYDGPAPFDTTVVRGLRAVIGALRGSKITTGAEQEDARAALRTDPADIRYTDRVLDESTGVLWDVVFAHARTGLGLDHVSGELRLVSGEPT